MEAAKWPEADLSLDCLAVDVWGPGGTGEATRRNLREDVIDRIFEDSVS